MTAPLADTGLSEADANTVKQGVLQLLSAFRASAPLGDRPCTDVFTLGEPNILDTTLTGATGKVRVDVPVTAKVPVGYNDVMVQGCYGAPKGGWNQGQTSMSRYVVAIEKWQSGWQVVRPQSLVQTD